MSSYRTGSQSQQQQPLKEPAGASRLNTSLKPTSRASDSSKNNNNINKPKDPLAITPEVVWGNRNNNNNAAGDGSNVSPTRPRAGSKDRVSGSKQQQQPTSPTTQIGKEQLVQQQAAKQEALARSQAAEKAAAEKAYQLSKSQNTVLNEEVVSLREENQQLRDIERQFWTLLDEREQLQEEVSRLSNGISSSSSKLNQQSFSNNSVKPSFAAAKYYNQLRVPKDSNEAEKNYLQMAVALDEAMNMLIQLDRTAAARFTGSSQQSASVVLPGTLIHRFLEFTSAERNVKNTLTFSSPSGNNNNKNAIALGSSSASPSVNDFKSKTAELVEQMQQNVQSLASQNNNKQTTTSRSGSATPGKIVDISQIQQQYVDNNNNTNASSYQSTLHTSNLSQALRLAQDEIHHLKMELDRSDLSRLQALDDVDKMQKQIQVLSSSIVELRSAYASARAQADANAKSAETVHEVTVRLAERDAEIAHLKGRIAEMQRLAASGGSALAADTTRIRQELASRVASRT